MFSRVKGFLFKPKDYQQVQYFWKFLKDNPLKPEPKNEIEKQMEHQRYDELLKKNPEDYLVDPLEFRVSPKPEDYKTIMKRPRRSILVRMSYSPDLHDYSFNGIRKKMLAYSRESVKTKQLYDAHKVKEIGPDLAAAHFIISKNGGVKFLGRDVFVQNSPKVPAVLPNYKDDNYKVEAINAAEVPLMYEGLLNLSDLKYLRWLSVKGNLEFDNWCLDRLSLIAPNLEYLDVSGCKKLDHGAFGCFYRFKDLKCLNVQDTDDSNAFKLACLTLESQYPELVVIGLALRRAPKSAFSSCN